MFVLKNTENYLIKKAICTMMDVYRVYFSGFRLLYKSDIHKNTLFKKPPDSQTAYSKIQLAIHNTLIINFSRKINPGIGCTGFPIAPG